MNKSGKEIANDLGMSSDNVRMALVRAKRKARQAIHILQGALYCKGQGLDPIYLNGVYTDTTKEAVRKFQEYAGLSTTDQTGIANAEVCLYSAVCAVCKRF